MHICRFVVIGLSLIMAGCTPSVSEEAGGDKMLVKDFRGKTLHFDGPVENVVCLIESALSGIYMLHQEDKLVGVPSAVYEEHLFRYYAALDPRIKSESLPTPGNWDFISIEQIAGLEPDLVIIWASQSEAIASLENLGIPVYAVMLHSFDDVYKEISDFGHLFDCSDRARKLITYTKNNLSSIQQKTDTNRKNVYFMWAQGITETSGENSTVNELLLTAGTTNACKLNAEHVTVSIEKIYDWNPDLIVMWYNEKLDPQDIVSNPLLQGLKAVQQKNVFELPDPFACDFWTLKMQYAVQLISNWAYPGEEKTKTARDMILQKMYLQLYDKKLPS